MMLVANHKAMGISMSALTAHRPFDSGKLATALLFLPPALLLFTLFVMMPVVEAAWYSGFNWNGFGSPKNWIGFDNYRFVFDNRAFALRNFQYFGGPNRHNPHVCGQSAALCPPSPK